MCYVGKATKIFIAIVTLLVLAGLVSILCIRRRVSPTECGVDDVSCKPRVPQPSSLSPPAFAVPPAQSPPEVIVSGGSPSQPRRYLLAFRGE